MDVITITGIVGGTAALIAPLSAAAAVYLTKSTESWRIRYTARKEAYMDAFEVAAKQFQKQIDLLVAELKTATLKINELEDKHDSELKEVYSRLSACKDEHAKSLIEQERLRGDFRELKVYVERNWSHEQRNEKHIEEVHQAIKRITGDSGGQATVPQS